MKTVFNSARIRASISLLVLSVSTSVLFIFSSDILSHNEVICPSKRFLGIPCPGCGMGRATLHLLHGSIWQSLIDNPFILLFTLGVLMLVARLIRDIVKSENKAFRFLYIDIPLFAKILLGLAIVAIWLRNLTIY